MAGFGNPLSLRNINDNHICDIEESIRKRDFPELKSLQYVKKVFGEVDLNTFQFRRGDVALIKELADHVKATINKSGLKHFTTHSKVNENEIGDKKSCDESNTLAQYLLNKLLDATNRNSQRKPEGYRYDPEVKLFASYLRMITGPLAYETIYKNLPAAIPSLSSTNRYIRASNVHVQEGILRCDELRVHLESRQFPLVVSLSEDGTRVVDRVQYDSITNQLIGFVPDIDPVNGLPIPFQFPARDAEEIVSHFSNENTVASFLNVVMAQPIKDAPPFCLLIYGTDSRYCAKDVVNRWKYITLELKKVGIRTLCWSSDSEPKFNASMRQLTEMGKKTEHDWFSCPLDSIAPFFFQDIYHIITKMRNLLLRLRSHSTRKLPFGKYLIQLEHLTELIAKVDKDRHFLTPSTLNPADRQNFESARRMCSTEVICLLREYVKESDGTMQYLHMMRDLIEAFTNKTLTPLQRIRKVWYSLFLARIWRQSILLSKKYTLKENFLTLNCYTCIEINAHSLVLCLLYLKKTNEPELFLPHLFNSQPCEATFRKFRSMTSAYSVVTNCTVKETISRIGKIQLQNEIQQKTSQFFVYPRSKKDDSLSIIHPLPTSIEIYNEIILCKRTAIATATKLGLITNTKSNQKSLVCGVKMYDPNARNKTKRLKQNDVENTTLYIPNLKNIQLKDYSGKLKQTVIDVNGPYVEFYSTTGKRIIVLKKSLVWLLRRESHRLSSDRLQRVKYYAKKTILKSAQSTKPKKKYNILKNRTKKQNNRLRKN